MRERAEQAIWWPWMTQQEFIDLQVGRNAPPRMGREPQQHVPNRLYGTELLPNGDAI